MRRGLMRWREDELSVDDVCRRQRRLQSAMERAGLDAVLVYTNHVRSAGVTYLTGFTPYWSDALLLVPREGEPVLATALSKRVGEWIRSVSPTGEIVNSPTPGRVLGATLTSAGARRVGVLELDRLPNGLAAEITATFSGELIDATEIFASVRSVADAAEIRLAARADGIAAEALRGTDTGANTAGEVTATAERAVRLARAEECYVAVAPDLTRGTTLARFDGATPLGPVFAIRLSMAYNGVWIRRTQTFARDAAEAARITDATARLQALCERLDLAGPVSTQLARFEGLPLLDWCVEAPAGTRPLARVAEPGREATKDLPYGVFSAAVAGENSPVLIARTVGLSRGAPPVQAAA